MHLVEVLSLRSVPAAGLSIGLTRRCPLKCSHCSTSSTLESEEFPSKMFVDFVDTFHINNHPEILAMSGGEVMLRPELVRELAERAHKVGTRSTVLSGMFFARSRRIPPEIKEAIKAIDHFSVSIDMFHEREVSRIDIFHLLDTLISDSTDVSIHIVGQGASDPYVEKLVQEIESIFGSKVPMLVNALSSFGRAKSWLEKDKKKDKDDFIDASPCSMAAWPVVGFDGTIVACSNDNALENRPAHLCIGHANNDNWETIRSRTITSNMLRAIRLFGPEYITDRFSDLKIGCDGYCGTCMKITEDLKVEQRVDEVMAKPSTAVLEEYTLAMHHRADALLFAQRHGISRYADLVTLGAPK
jgi:pyruvate-formate lyase-activating enzyme